MIKSRLMIAGDMVSISFKDSIIVNIYEMRKEISFPFQADGYTRYNN